MDISTSITPPPSGNTDNILSDETVGVNCVILDSSDTGFSRSYSKSASKIKRNSYEAENRLITSLRMCIMDNIEYQHSRKTMGWFVAILYWFLYAPEINFGSEKTEIIGDAIEKELFDLSCFLNDDTLYRKRQKIYDSYVETSSFSKDDTKQRARPLLSVNRSLKGYSYDTVCCSWSQYDKNVLALSTMLCEAIVNKIDLVDHVNNTLCEQSDAELSLFYV